MSFSTLSDYFYDFEPTFKYHTQKADESVGFPDAELYDESFEKQN